jgi:RNA polymerase sigma factor (TIGR02999 family)
MKPPTISSLIAAADAGDRSAAKALFAALYAELRRVARRQLARRGVSLSTTTLLHEAYLQMVARAGTAFADRGRFLGYAASVMRGLIIDHARQRKALKRGGQFEITIYEDESVASPTFDELSRIGAALDQLAADEPLLAQLVDLKFFCGFTFEEIAAMHEVSARTVRRQWEKARIYLHGLVTDE